MQAGSNAPLPWENLVTDGHVRAARVRWMRPWLIATAIIFILVGLFLLFKVRPPARGSENVSALMNEVTRAQAPAEAAVVGLPPLSPAVTAAAASNPATEIPQIIAAVLSGLNQSGNLPANIGHASLTPTTFWQSPWPQGKLASTGTPDVKLVGGAFNASPPNTPFSNYPPSPQRWIGVFRKKDSTWDYATLDGPGFVSVAGQADVLAESIPLTLKPILPKGK